MNTRVQEPAAIAPPKPGQEPAKAGSRLVWQRTLGSEVSLTGTGLHSGSPVSMRLCPAPVDHGIEFVRTDLRNGARSVRLSANNVTDTRLCTLLSNAHGGFVGTIEHLMAALHSSAISNLTIELDGPEVPILDGSSAIFVQLFAEAGLQNQSAHQSFLKIVKPVGYESKGRKARLLPHAEHGDDRLTLKFSIDFDAACIGRQELEIDLSEKKFASSICAARTFGFAREIDALREQGLVKGGSMSNAILVHDDKVVNPEGLRFDDEFVRHKLLDAIGDLYIEGKPIIGRFEGSRAGHEMTNELMRAVLSDPSSYEIVTL